MSAEGFAPAPAAALAAVPPLTRREREGERERWTGRKALDLTDEQRQAAWAAGYEPGPDGYIVGRDPRTMTPAELAAMGHDPMPPIETIRAKCLDCMAGSPHEVRYCVAVLCVHWPKRMGSDPFRAPRQLTAEQREAQRERGRALARRRAGAVAEDDRRSSTAGAAAEET